MRVEVDDRYVGAFAGVQHRHSSPDTGVAPRNERHHALELAASTILRRVELRLQHHLCFRARLGHVLVRQRRFRLLASTSLDGRLRFIATTLPRLGLILAILLALQLALLLAGLFRALAAGRVTGTGLGHDDSFGAKPHYGAHDALLLSKELRGRGRTAPTC